MDPVELEIAATSDGLLSFEIIDGTTGTEREFLMTYDAAAILHSRLGELLSSKPD